MEPDIPGRDEVLDAFDVLIRAEVRQLRPTLDAVYEAGFREGVKAVQRQVELEKRYSRIDSEPVDVPVA